MIFIIYVFISTNHKKVNKSKHVVIAVFLYFSDILKRTVHYSINHKYLVVLSLDLHVKILLSDLKGVLPIKLWYMLHSVTSSPYRLLFLLWSIDHTRPTPRGGRASIAGHIFFWVFFCVLHKKSFFYFFIFLFFYFILM